MLTEFSSEGGDDLYNNEVDIRQKISKHPGKPVIMFTTLSFMVLCMQLMVFHLENHEVLRFGNWWQAGTSYSLLASIIVQGPLLVAFPFAYISPFTADVFVYLAEANLWFMESAYWVGPFLQFLAHELAGDTAMPESNTVFLIVQTLAGFSIASLEGTYVGDLLTWQELMRLGYWDNA
jgi:hypothetical protein